MHGLEIELTKSSMQLVLSFLFWSRCRCGCRCRYPFACFVPIPGIIARPWHQVRRITQSLRSLQYCRLCTVPRGCAQRISTIRTEGY